MGRALCHEGRGLLWAKLAIPRGDDFPGPKSGNSAVKRTREYLRWAGISTDAEKIHSTTIKNRTAEKSRGGVACTAALPFWWVAHLGDLRGITR